MTPREIAEKIDIQKNCDGIDCVSDKCQFCSYDCTSSENIIYHAKQWLINNPKEQTMNEEITKSIKVLSDAIKKELPTMKEAIEKINNYFDITPPKPEQMTDDENCSQYSPLVKFKDTK